MMKNNATLSLNTGELLTLEMNGKAPVHAEYFQQEDDIWQLKIIPSLAKKLRQGSEVVLSCGRNRMIYKGQSKILDTSPVFGMCSVSIPPFFEGRPMRRLPRIAADITTAVMYISVHDGKEVKQLSGKSENRIVDLNINGALLASKNRLDCCSKNLMLATSFDQSIDLNTDHAYFKASIRRDIQNKKIKDYPFAYGIEFSPLTEKHKSAISAFITSLPMEQELMQYKQA